MWGSGEKRVPCSGRDESEGRIGRARAARDLRNFDTGFREFEDVFGTYSAFRIPAQKFGRCSKHIRNFEAKFRKIEGVSNTYPTFRIPASEPGRCSKYLRTFEEGTRNFEDVVRTIFKYSKYRFGVWKMFRMSSNPRTGILNIRRLLEASSNFLKPASNCRAWFETASKLRSGVSETRSCSKSSSMFFEFPRRTVVDASKHLRNPLRKFEDSPKHLRQRGAPCNAHTRVSRCIGRGCAQAQRMHGEVSTCTTRLLPHNLR